MKNKKECCINQMRASMRAYHEAEQLLISNNPTLVDSDLENYSDSYKWLRLPIPDEQPETVRDMIRTGLEYFACDCLSGVLLEVLKNQVPKGIHFDGIGIDRIGNSFRFCISGSTSLTSLQSISEQYKSAPCFQDEK